jgi:hypothetical protein
MKLLYKPFGMLFGVLGGLIGSAAFASLWKRLGHEDEAPEATTANRGWGEVLTAALLQGAIFGVVRAAVDRAGAVTYQKVTGTWPGKE